MMETDRWNVLKIVFLHLQKTDEQVFFFFNLFNTTELKLKEGRMQEEI